MLTIAQGARPGTATTVSTKDNVIRFDTGGGASLELAGDTVTIRAVHVVIKSSSTASVTASASLSRQATAGDVVIQGGPMVRINPDALA